MGVVFLYVVSSLRQNLISDRQAHLEVIARGQQNAPGLTQEFRSGTHIHQTLLHAAHIANGSASAYMRTPGGVLRPTPEPPRPVLPPGSRIVRTALHNGIG